MNPFGFSLRTYAIVAAALSGAAALYWIIDVAQDSRELNVKNTTSKQEKRTNEAELKGRARARACHALGPDRLWNVEHERCDINQPVRSPGG